MGAGDAEMVAFVAAREADLRAAIELVECCLQPSRWDWLGVHVALDDLRWAGGPVPAELQARLRALGYGEGGGNPATAAVASRGATRPGVAESGPPHPGAAATTAHVAESFALLDQPLRSDAPGPRARTRRHDWIDERSRALGEAVGRHVHDDPALVSAALERLGHWEAAARQRGDTRVLPGLRAWRQVLEHSSVSEISALLGEASVRASRLRQSSPFVGVLSDEERGAIFRRFEEL